jgi:hypothetical protein
MPGHTAVGRGARAGVGESGVSFVESGANSHYARPAKAGTPSVRSAGESGVMSDLRK